MTYTVEDTLEYLKNEDPKRVDILRDRMIKVNGLMEQISIALGGMKITVAAVNDEGEVVAIISDMTDLTPLVEAMTKSRIMTSGDAINEFLGIRPPLQDPW